MKNLFLYITCLFALSACHSKSSKPVVDSAAVYSVPDQEAISKTVQDAYAAISFNKGEQPNYDQLNKYCIPRAQFINSQSDSVYVTSLNQFIYLYRTMIESQHIQYFHEEEVFGKTEQFGNVAQHISSYKTYINSTDSVAEKGVDFFELIKTKNGWKISGVTWDVEKPGLKIPGYYLK
jgi:hypothetical protein